MRTVRELIDESNRMAKCQTRILRIWDDETRDGVPKWIIIFDDGRKASTVKQSLADECIRLHNQHVPVTIQIDRTSWGYALLSITEAV
jgi:hypothetical protein